MSATIVPYSPHEVAGGVGVLYGDDDGPQVFLDGLRDRDGAEIAMSIEQARSLANILGLAADGAEESVAPDEDDEPITPLEALNYITETLDQVLETLHTDVRFIREKIVAAWRIERDRNPID